MDKIKYSRSWTVVSWTPLRGGLPVNAKAAAKSPRRLRMKVKAAAKPAAAAVRASSDADVPAVGDAAPLVCPQVSMAAGGKADEAEVPVVDGMPLPHAAVEAIVSTAGARPFGVLDFIAKGAYGRVYRAVQYKTATIVAIKVIDIDGSGRWTKEIVQELMALKMLCGHPNIVSMIQASVDLFTFAFVFEYCEMSLGEFIKQRRFAKFASVPGIHAAFTHQVFEGVRFIHSHDIIHRDIKPANVLMGRSEEPHFAAAHSAGFCLKIADFGSARFLPAFGDVITGAWHDPLTGMFTIWYRPIELFLGAPSYGTAADVWSASCTCGEMCLGAPIFPGDTADAVIAKIMREVGTPSPSQWPALAQMPRFAHVMRIARREHFPEGGCFKVLRKCASAIGDGDNGKYVAFLLATLAPVPSVRWTAAEVCAADLR